MITYDPNAAVHNIVVVGLGGTGSQLSRSLARILYDMDRNGMHLPSVLFVDPDCVEEKNVGRQMFTLADVGQFKAELLARRFNAAMGLEIGWIGEEFDPDRHVMTSGTTLLIGCVDNHVARQALAQKHMMWLDCGNHTDSGQVVFGTTSNPATVLDAMRRCVKDNKETVSALPNAAAVFPQLLEPAESGMAVLDASCAELIELGVQHLLINDAIATAAAAYIFRLLYRKPLQSFMTFVSLDAVRPIAITPENIEQYVGSVA